MQNIDRLEFDNSLASNSATSVAEQVANDLNHYVNSAGDRQKRLTMISKKMGLHLKTLNRICSLENKPSYITVFKIYRFLLNETDDSKVLENCPEVVREYLKKATPQTIEKSIAYTSDAEAEVNNNQVALELVVLCSTGQLNTEDVKDRFGNYGLEIVKKLVTKRLLSEVKFGVYTIGQIQMNMSPETVIKMGLQITSSYAKPENGYEQGNHHHAFYAEGLSEEAYAQWLKIDEEAYLKKVQIAKNPKSFGDIKAYTFNSTDTLEKKGST